MEASKLIEEIISLAEVDDVSPPPTTSDLREHSDISYHYFKKEFGGWTEALEEAGFTPSKNQKNSKVSREDLLEEIHRLSEEECGGNPPRERDVTEFSKYSMKPFYREFGKWNNALNASEIDGVYQYKDIPREDLIGSIRGIFEEHGVLLKKDFVKYSEYSLNPYDRRFGGFNNAVREAGYEPKNYRGISKDQLKEEIKRLSDELGRTPLLKDIQEHGKFGTEIYYRKFGTWNNALKEVGMDINSKNYKKQELKQAIYEFYEEEGVTPSQNDILEKYGISNEAYRNHFGSWTKAIKECGFTPVSRLSGEKHYNWGGGHKDYYGPSWLKQRRKVRKRDQYSCRICGKGKEELGRNPSVHHITSTRYWFIDKEHEVMNSLTNLITLCQKHHIELEGKFKGRSHEKFEELAREYLGE